MAMTNEQIIMLVSLELMEAGIIGDTGEYVENGDGEPFRVPEPIHTYDKWKEQGFQVRKGEHAIASFEIWKMVRYTDKETGEKKQKMMLRKAAFFTQGQCEPCRAK